MSPSLFRGRKALHSLYSDQFFGEKQAQEPPLYFSIVGILASNAKANSTPLRRRCGI
jgi:hypothetical protein